MTGALPRLKGLVRQALRRDLKREVRKRSVREDAIRSILESRTVAGIGPQPLPLILSLFALLAFSSCAPLPTLDDYATLGAATAPKVLGPDAPLPPEVSNALMEGLTKQVAPTDMLQRYARRMDVVSGSPWVTGNKVTLLIDGPAAFEAMLTAIRGAKDHINIETFSFSDDAVGQRFAEVLLQKQKEGVQVNLLYDSVGSWPTPAAFFRRLRDGGIQVREFNPINPLKVRGDEWLLTHRDHRRIVIVDGTVAFTGSSNLSNIFLSGLFWGPTREQEGEHVQPAWRDTDVQIAGPAVATLQELFLETWANQKGPEATRNYFPPLTRAGDDLVQVIGSAPGRTQRLSYLMYLSAFTYAENVIHLTTPYFVPDVQVMKALTDAAERGVDVKIILPGNNDSNLVFHAGRSHYAALLESGVKVYERGTEAILHAKTAVIDGLWSTVGTSNLDSWSLLHNDEVDVVVVGRDFAAKMEAMFEEDLGTSTQIHLAEWKTRPFTDRIKEWFTSVFGRWL